MKIFYLHQKALLSFFVFLFSIGIYSGRAQSISLSLDTQYPPVQNIGPGSDNNIIGAYSVYLFSGSTTLTSVTFTTKGTYNVSDLKANSFKLRRGYPSFPQGDPVLSQTAIVASGNTIVFSGLSEVFSSGDYRELYVTADVDSSATPGNTLFLGSTLKSNFTFSSGTTGGGPPLSSTNVQTIGIPLPVVAIYNSYNNSYNISPGSSDNHLYEFYINSSEADAELTSVTFSTQGTYITSDIAANGFKLWYHDYFNYPQRDVLVDSAASVASGGNIVFSGLSVNINKYHNWEMPFYVTADLSSGAVAGHTIGINATPLSNFTFTQAQSISGSNPLQVGALSTVTVPTITLSSLPVASGTISPSSVNNIIYQENILPSGSNAALTQVSFTTTGTYQLSDIASGGFKLWRASDQGGKIILDTMISSVNPVPSGSNVDFNLSNYTVDEDNGNNPIFVLTIDISGAAVLNRTIGIQAISSANVTAVAGSITGSGTAGGIQTINIPSITFTPSGPAAGIISPGTLVILHAVQIDVTGAPATFGGASFQLSGTYVPSDFSSGGVSLVYHKTSNLQEDMDNGQFSYLSRFDTMPSSGQSLIFQFISSKYTNPTIPLGSGYISVTSWVSSSAVTGNTIQVASPGVSGYTFASGNESGTTGTGGVQTIGIPAISVSAITTPAGNIARISNQVLYKIKLDVTNANAALDSLVLTTGGSYTTSDVYSFSLYLSQDSVLNTDSDKYIGYANGISSGDTLIFNTNAQINAGTSGYLFVAANINYYAVIGRTINITAAPSTAFAFTSGAVTGSFPLPAGGLQTIAAPGPITLNFPAVAPSNITTGSDNNIIYKFNITASSGAPIPFPSIDLTTSGNFVASDIKPSGFKLWYSASGSFAGSTSVSIASTVNNGGHLQFYIYNMTIDPGTTAYFFVTANISSSAVVGHTINVAATVAANFSFFPSGTATGSGAAGGVQTFAAPGSITLSFPTVAASDITPGSDDNIIYRFNATVSGAATSLSYLSLFTSGNFVASDIKTHGFKLWYNTSNVFAGSVMIKDVAAIDNGGILYFSSINTSIASGKTGYFFVTASTSSTAIVGHTIQIAATDSTDFSFGADIVTGSGGAGGMQTINITVTALFNKKPTGRTELYPNPSKERDVVILSTGNAHSKIISLYNSTGEIIKSYEADGDIVYLDSPESGMYMIIIQDQYDNQIETRKLVVE